MHTLIIIINCMLNQRHIMINILSLNHISLEDISTKEIHDPSPVIPNHFFTQGFKKLSTDYY